MDITTPLGMIIGMACIIISIAMDDPAALPTYINWPSVFITFGGVIASTLSSFPMRKLQATIKASIGAFSNKPIDINADVEKIIEIANIARRDGILALEEVTGTMEDPFLKKGIMLVVDGSDPELIQSVLETELAFIKERHAETRSVLDAAAAYSPSFGMIGTLIGLINMLRSLDDMASLGPNMSVALITTLYGSMLANMVFNPLVRKLKSIGSDEYLRKELILEGILSIQDGENPRLIREKLNAFLSRAQLGDSQTSLGESQRSSGE